MKFIKSLKLLSLMLAIICVLSLFACQSKEILLDGTYIYKLGGEIPTFSYVFNGNQVTMYQVEELQAVGTYRIEGEYIYMQFEVSTVVGRYDKKADTIIMTTSDYGDILLEKE